MPPVRMFSSSRLSKNKCIKNIFKIMGNKINKPASLVLGIIMSKPANI